jgi:hypothetical protein
MRSPSLHRNLGASYLSLVHPSHQDSMAVWIHRQAAGSFGSLDLVPFEAAATESDWLKPGQFYLFRLDEVALVEVAPKFDNVALHVRPPFWRFVPEEVGGGLIFGIAAARYTPAIVGILELVAERFPKYLVGLITPGLYDRVNVSVG